MGLPIHRFRFSAETLSVYSQRQALALVVLIMIKIGFSIWNFSQYYLPDQPDAVLHLSRVYTCGIQSKNIYYNQPVYYFMACPLVFASVLIELDQWDRLGELFGKTPSGEGQLAAKAHKLNLGKVVIGLPGSFLQIVNLIFLLTFYYLWSFKLFPLLTGNPTSAFYASIFLLSLPGYQHLAMMIHPDNFLIFAEAVAFCYWLVVSRKSEISLRDICNVGLVFGVLSMTRPFAVVPLACLSASVLVHLWRRAGSKTVVEAVKHIAVPVLAFSTILVVIGGSWWVYRYATLGQILDETDKRLNYYEFSLDRFKRFDYKSYYLTLHPVGLLKTPNRNFRPYEAEIARGKASGKIRMKNSFPTVLMSDFWGDHWLYFSGPKFQDRKVGFKRIILVYTMLLTPIFLVMVVGGTYRMVRSLAQTQDWEIRAAALGTAVLGALIWFLWQATWGVSTGWNSAVKFTYIAFVVPFFVAFMFNCRLQNYVPVWLIKAALAILFVVAAPIAIFWT